MKALGILIIIAGLLMIIFLRFTYANEEKVAASVKINKEEDKPINWPAYSAGVAVIAGVIVLLAEKKKA